MKEKENPIKRFWEYLKKDTWDSWLVSIILIVLVIKIIFFPLLALVTATSLPLVVVESCSMYHEAPFDEWWNKNAAFYEAKNISRENFENYKFKDGLNKGDIILVLGENNYKMGDIIIFEPNPEASSRYPIIHRTITLDPTSTKGDHNVKQFITSNNPQKLDETNIPDDRIIGKAVVRIPLLGWVKLIWFEAVKPAEQRGFCR